MLCDLCVLGSGEGQAATSLSPRTVVSCPCAGRLYRVRVWEVHSPRGLPVLEIYNVGVIGLMLDATAASFFLGEVDRLHSVCFELLYVTCVRVSV